MIEFDWLIHYKCNYRCPFCFFNGTWEEVEGKNKYLPSRQWISAWRRIYNRYGEFKIIITGGEPLIYPEFLVLIEELNSFSHISFDTNLSCPLEYLDSLANRVSIEKIFLGLSFHPGFADLNSFINKASFLKENGFDFRIHYVTYPPHLLNLEKYKDIFTDKGFRFVPIPFRGNYRSK